MNNFYRLADNVDVVPLMNALNANPDLWNQHTVRTQHEETAHGQVSDILLRFNDLDGGIIDNKECINFPAIWRLPQARQMINALMARVEGERLGRCIIAKLPVGASILPHIDGGAPATYYDRYHIVLASTAGCLFRCGDETVNMKTGEVWWFNNAIEHEVINNSAHDRINLIVDIRVAK